MLFQRIHRAIFFYYFHCCCCCFCLWYADVPYDPVLQTLEVNVINDGMIFRYASLLLGAALNYCHHDHHAEELIGEQLQRHALPNCERTAVLAVHYALFFCCC